MTKPQGEHGAVQASLEQFHCFGVTEHMRRDPFLFQRGTSLSCDQHILGQEVLDSVGTQCMASCTGKDVISGLPVTLKEACS